MLRCLAILALAPAALSLVPRPAVASARASTAVPLHADARSLGRASSTSSDTLPLYIEYQVEEPVTIVTWPRPQYPDSLKSAGIEGEVLIQFAVDARGQLERGTLRILRATHPAFERAVTATVPGARFTPAVLHGKRVRQLVQQGFVFRSKR